MNDMSATIVAKSDQINAADLIGTNRTITIKEVRIKAGDDQPVTIMIEGDKKAFRPCKGVRRLLVRVWGRDANKYIGQSLTIYCDPTVTWAGKEEGGIRVSHMTGLDEKIVEFMRTSKAGTKPYTVQPLSADVRTMGNAKQTPEQWARSQIESAAACPDVAALDALIAKGQKAMAKLERDHAALHTGVSDAYDTRRDYFADQDGDDGDDPFGEEGATTEEPPASEDKFESKHATAAAHIRGMIAVALGQASWESAKDELDKIAADLPESLVATLRAELDARRVELNGGEG